ncbi:MAG: cytidine deaminase [Conexivisphaerales archaeon]
MLIAFSVGTIYEGDNNKRSKGKVRVLKGRSSVLDKMKKVALESMNRAYSPYSGIKVGASILDDRGKVYSGCNVENASYGLTICAERVAAVKAVSSGSRCFRSVLIVSSLEGFTYPCGACRQFLAEFSCKDRGIDVVLLSRDGKTRVIELENLLPNAFMTKKKS